MAGYDDSLNQTGGHGQPHQMVGRHLGRTVGAVDVGCGAQIDDSIGEMMSDGVQDDVLIIGQVVGAHTQSPEPLRRYAQTPDEQ